MDVLKIAFSGQIFVGLEFTRAEVIERLVEAGYSERTAVNHVTPSRHGGMLFELIQSGCVEKSGPLKYRFISNDFVRNKKPKNTATKFFTGSPKDGWKPMGLMSDSSIHEVEWRLCGVEYEPGCYNFKLYADGRVPNKANFWLMSKHGKLVMSKDAVILKNSHPDIFENFASDVKECFC